MSTSVLATSIDYVSRTRTIVSGRIHNNYWSNWLWQLIRDLSHVVFQVLAGVKGEGVGLQGGAAPIAYSPAQLFHANYSAQLLLW